MKGTMTGPGMNPRTCYTALARSVHVQQNVEQHVFENGHAHVGLVQQADENAEGVEAGARIESAHLLRDAALHCCDQGAARVRLEVRHQLHDTLLQTPMHKYKKSNYIKPAILSSVCTWRSSVAGALVLTAWICSGTPFKSLPINQA